MQNNKKIRKKRTKIVCTVGPASSSVDVLTNMIDAGMNVARLNFSHGDQAGNLTLLKRVRQAAKRAGQRVAILQDLQGPKIRVGKIAKEGIELREGQTVTVRAGVAAAEDGTIPVPYKRFAENMKRGDRILITDGTRELEVTKVSGNTITAKVLLGGLIVSYKGINVPSVTLPAESLTSKDKADLAFGLQHGIDFVALSFVRSAEDVRLLRTFIADHLPRNMDAPQIVVKIEKHEALENFDEILEETDAVMIARGDLGLETPVAQLPLRQKELIAKCTAAGKPVITATEMLASMEHNPRPTRAEVSDVANAVIDHTDAVMLSAESAMGRYPVRAVQTMAEIIAHTEEAPVDILIPDRTTHGETVPAAMAAGAVELVRRIHAAALLVVTESGYSARMAARLRPDVPLFAVSQRARTLQQLVLSWGVTPIEMKGSAQPEKMIEKALAQLRSVHALQGGDRVVVVSGLKQHGGHATAIRVFEVS